MDDMKPKRRWMPIILAISLALNFAVGAAVIGAALRHKGDARAESERGGGGRKGAAFVNALPPQARNAVRDQLRRQPRLRMDNQALLDALRQEPFDAATAARVLNAQRDHGLARNDIARDAWFAQVEAMSVQERQQYADRLEELAAARKNKKRKDEGK